MSSQLGSAQLGNLQLGSAADAPLIWTIDGAATVAFGSASYVAPPLSLEQAKTSQLGRAQLGRLQLGSVFLGETGFEWRIAGVANVDWVAPVVEATWRIDGSIAISFTGDPINFWVVQGSIHIEIVPAVGGSPSAWNVDGISSLTWTGTTSSATFRIDGTSTLVWAVKPDAAAESCLTDDGVLPQAPGRGGNYVF